MKITSAKYLQATRKAKKNMRVKESLKQHQTLTNAYLINLRWISETFVSYFFIVIFYCKKIGTDKTFLDSKVKKNKEQWSDILF